MSGTTLEDFTFNITVKGGKVVKSEISGVNVELDKMEGKAKKAGAGIDFFKNKLLRTLIPLVGFGALLRQTLSFAAQGEQLAFLAQESNVAVGKIETLGRALREFGGDNSTAANTLKSLNQQVRDMRRGMGGQLTEASWRFGLDLRGVKDGEQALFRIAQRMEGLSAARQLELGRALGLDPATMRLVQGGLENLNQELERASKRNIYSEKDIENAKKLQRSLREVKDSLNQVWAVVARWLLPVFQTVADNLGKFFDLVSRHENVVKAFFAFLAAIMAVIAVKSVIAFAPFYLFIAALLLIAALVALVYDEFTTFFNGGDSMLGRLANRFGIVKDAIGMLTDAFDILFNLIDAIAALCRGDFSGAWRHLSKAGETMVKYFSKFLNILKQIGDFLTGGMLSKGLEFISNITGGGNDKYMMQDGVKYITTATGQVVPLGVGSGGGVKNETKTQITNNKVDVVIEGDADEAAVKEGVQQGLGATLDITNFTSGGG